MRKNIKDKGMAPDSEKKAAKIAAKNNKSTFNRQGKLPNNTGEKAHRC